MQTLLTTRYTMATSSGRFASSGEIAVLVLLAALAFATPARAQSSDATLSALTVSDVTLAPEFDSATENYTGSVAYSVSQVTVTPTVNESSATVQYLDSSDTAIADADASTTGQQVNLLVGENTIKVKVTAGNGTTTKTYTVKVTRASNVTGQPALSGFPRVGDVVSASTDGIADPDGLTGVSYVYQWVRVDGTTETNIPGATSEIYTLAAADVGKTVKVRVSFTDDAGNPEMATSGAFPNIPFPETVSAVLPAAVCRVPDIGGERELLSATLTVEIYNFFVQGYLSNDASTSVGNQVGDLSSTGPFTIPGNPNQHSIGALYTQVLLAPNWITIEFHPRSVEFTTLSRLALYVCDERFLMGGPNLEATYPLSDEYSRHSYANSGEWSTHSTREIRLTWDENEKPTFDSAKLDGTSLEITFNEPLDSSKVPATSAFAVNVGGAAVSLAASGVAVSGRTVTLTLASAPAGTATVTVNYTKPSSSALADRIGAEVDSFSSAKSVTNNVPALESAELAADGAALTLTYDQALDTASVPAASAFEVKVNAVTAALAGTSPVSISGSTVVLTLATPAREGDTVTVAYTKPSSNPVQESSGNDAASFTARDVTNSSTLNATGKPAISGVRRVGEVLTADKGTIADPQGLTNADNGDSGYAYSYQWVRVDGSTETDISSAASATYTLGADDEGKKVRVRASFKDDADNAEEKLTSDPFPETEADTILPMGVCNVPTYTGGAVEIWSGELTLGTDDAGRFGFGTSANPVYGTLEPREIAHASTQYTVDRAEQRVLSSSRLMYFTLDTALAAGDVPKLVLHDCDTPLALQSATSSAREAFTWTLAPEDVADWSTYSSRTLRLSHDDMAPTVQSHALENAVLTLTFTEALDEGSVPASAAFDVQVNGADARLAGATPVTVSGDTVTLTLASAPAETDAVTVEYTPPSANPLRDASRNDVPAFGPEEVGYEGPRVSSATVVGAALTIAYNEALDTGSEPAASAFAVTVDASSRTVSNVGVSGSDVTLTLSGAVRRGQAVQLSYTVPASNPIRDTDGNDAVGIVDLRVDNNTFSVPGAPRNLRAAAGNTEVTLSWVAPADDGGTPITDYEVRYAEGSAVVSSGTHWSSAGTDSREVVTGLLNDRLHAFEVRAVNGEGASDTAETTATPIEADLTPPELENARVENESLELKYNEALDSGAVPPGSAFTVMEAGSRLRVSNVEVSGSRVVLTLASEASPGTSVTVSYSPPSGAGALRDRSENRAAAFTGESATNESRYTIRISAPTRVDEGGAFTFTVTRNGGLGEDAYALILVTDSGFPHIPGGAVVRNNGPGARVVEFDPGERSATGTMTPAFDGERDDARTLRVKLETAHFGLEDGTERNYRVAQPDTLTPGVRDRDAAMRVADARVEEAQGATLVFRVTLDRRLAEPTTVDYATTDGTATAGADYTATSGTLTFGPGETSKTVEVAVLDDDHDEGEETMTLTLSNARVAVIADGEATGRIRNRDVMPKAWIARFGRAATVQVVEHVEERLQAPREPGFRGRFAGRELRPGMEREMALSLLSRLGGTAGAQRAGAGMHDPLSGGVAGAGPLGTPGPGVGLGMAGQAGPMGSMTGQAGPMGAAVGPLGGPLGGGLLSGLGGDPLTGSAFALNRETGHGGVLSFWSRGAQSHFAGQEGALSLGGDVRTTMFGADYAKGRLVAGLSLGHSRGLGEYNGVTGGRVASAVTGLYPWLGYRTSDRVTVWGVAGYGSGGMLLTPEGGSALESGLSMKMAAAGTRGELVAGGAGGFTLAFKADALWVGTSIDGADGPTGRLNATAAVATRFRTGLEGSHAYTLVGRLSLTPSVEVGLRHDGGDAETGAGMDVGAGLVVSDSSTGLAVDVRVRTLLVHQAQGFRERGVALSLSYNPTPSSPLGFTARVAPSWGGQATSGAEALWGRETLAGMAHGGLAQGSRLDGEVGYGLPVGRRFIGTPRIGVRTSEYGREDRVGYGLGLLDAGSLSFELGVDVHRRESPMLVGTDKGLLGRATLGW